MEEVYMYKKLKEWPNTIQDLIKELSEEEINLLMKATWETLTEEKKISFLEEVME